MSWQRPRISARRLGFGLLALSLLLGGPGCAYITAGMVAFSSDSSRGGGGLVAPEITGVVPAQTSHAGGAQVVLHGERFEEDPPPSVSVAGVAALAVRTLDSTRLEVTVPRVEVVGPVDLVVTNPSGGTATLAGALELTNLLPVAVLQTPSDPQSQNVVLAFTLSDAESDVCNVALEAAVDGGPFQTIPPDQVLSGGTTGLATSPGGTSHSLTLDTSGLLPSQNGSLVVRITPGDGFADGTPGSSSSFTVVNNRPPTLSIVQPSEDAFEVAVTWRVSEPDAGDSVSVVELRFEDLLDGASGDLTLLGGVPAAVPAQVPAGAGGSTHVFVWDSLTDLGFGNNQLVQLTLSISDGTDQVSVRTAPFFVSNGPLGDAMVSPASVLRATGLAAGRLVGDDARPDLVLCSPETRDLFLFPCEGQQLGIGSQLPLPGTPVPIPEDLVWDGSVVVQAAAGVPPAGVAPGDFLGLPFDPGGGDPIGPRFFQVLSVAGGGALTLADPYGYAANDLLPGSPTLGGTVQGPGRTLRLAGFGGVLPDPFVPDPRPGQVAVLSVDDADPLTGSPDIVVLNTLQPTLRTAVVAQPAPAQVQLESLASATGGRSYLPGMRVAIGSPPPGGTEGVNLDTRLVLAVDPANDRLFLDAPLSLAAPVGQPVVPLASDFPFVPGHLANNAFYVLPRLPGGGFGPPQGTTASGGIRPTDLVVGDLGAPGVPPGLPDGIPDLLVVNDSGGLGGRGQLALHLRQPSAPGFAAPILLPVGAGGVLPAGSTHAHIADVTSDGLSDILVVHQGESSVSILRRRQPVGPGDPLFAETVVPFLPPIPGDAASVGTGDLDGDGHVDLALSGGRSQRIYLLRGADPDGAGPLASFPGGDLSGAAPQTLLVTQSPPPPPVLNGIPTSQPAPYLFCGLLPRRLAIADLNSDGRLDVLVPQSGSNSLGLFLNRGESGGVLDFEFVDLTASLAPQDVVALDFSGDGRTDVASLGNLYGDVAFFLQTTPGTLDRFVPFPVGAEPFTIAVAELDPARPGNELVVTLSGQNSLQVLGQDGAGGLVSLSPSPARNDVSVEVLPSDLVIPPSPTGLSGTLPFDVAAVDFDGDARDDVAVGLLTVDPLGALSGSAAILFSRPGAAPITTTSVVLQTPRSPGDIAVGDLIGSPAPDLAMLTRFSAISNQSFLRVFAGDGNGGFTPSLDLPTPRGSAIASADADGDGDLDLFTTSNEPNLHLFLQGPGGTLAPFGGGNGAVFATPPASFGLRELEVVLVADFNADLRPDVFLADTGAGAAGVAFQSGSPQFLPGDVLQLLTLDQPIEAAAGDLNGDGLPDLAVAFAASNQVGVYLQRPGVAKPFAEALASPFFLDAGPNPQGIAVGDVNNDGRADLLVTSRSARTLNVFFQR